MTTIEFPDVSHYQAGMKIQPGTKILVAKCTQATTVIDSAYGNFRSQAISNNVFFVGYHWLNHGNIAQQAQWYVDHCSGAPAMIDAEDVSGQTGYNGALTVDDILGFTGLVRQHGIACNLVYLPHWYWRDHMGSPDLTPLVKVGLHLVASEYRNYSETSWPSAYGHMNPEEWQFSDNTPYGNQDVDMNAYKGTVADFISLATGGPMPTLDLSQVVVTYTDPGNVQVQKSLSDWFHDVYLATWKGQGPEFGGLMTLLNAMAINVQTIATTVATLASANGGLTDYDRAAIKALTDAANNTTQAVAALNSRLSTP